MDHIFLLYPTMTICEQYRDIKLSLYLFIWTPPDVHNMLF